jgi:hypothetical protein
LGFVFIQTTAIAMKNVFTPFEEQDPFSLTHRIRREVVNTLVITHMFFSYLILLAGLVWCIPLLEEIIDKGRLPIESDARFLKGITVQISMIAIILGGYGSVFWGLLTATIVWVKEIRVRLNALKVGLIGLVLNILLFYLYFFSEVGQWILD